MESVPERREKHRRFNDRRRALLLALHEILFDHPPGPKRDSILLKELFLDYETDGALFVSPNDNFDEVTVTAIAGELPSFNLEKVFGGKGISALLEISDQTRGVVALTRFRKPSIFHEEAWESLWNEEFKSSGASGLLSIPLNPSKAPRSFLWLVLRGSSREWSSHDRELAEQVGALLAKARDKEP